MEERSSHRIYCQNMSKPSHKPPCIFWYILRAKPLTSYKAKSKSIEISRLPLLCSNLLLKSFQYLEIAGQTVSFINRQMLPIPTDHPLFPLSSSAGAATHRLLVLPSWHSHSPSNFPLFLKRKICLSLTEVDESTKASACFPSPQPRLPRR